MSALSSTRTVSSAIGLWLSPTARRGQGLARMLFDELDDIARHRGSHELVSLVDNKNFASMSLHRKSGFRAFS
ncbi:GNAT family N-acetyltransferase [Corynebacterium lactis]